MDFVITGLDHWDSYGSFNSKNMAQELARHHRVLFVDPPLDRSTLLQRERKVFRRSAEDSLHEVENNVWVLSSGMLLESVNALPFAGLFDYFNKRNNARFAASIQNAARKLGFRQMVHLIDNDIFKSFYLKELLRPALMVYYMRDNFTAVDYWRRHGSRLEPLLMKKADLVLTNSVYYQELALQHNRESYYIGQGCDAMFFDVQQAVKPRDLAAIRGPLIGYVGAVSALRLDIDLIAFMANARKDYSFVFVGPEDAAFERSGLHQLSNVYFLGKRNQEELPGYIRSFDVAINPQKVNPITIGNYPRKVDEYLAYGKPVVATRTKAMSVFSEYVYLADAHEDYLQLIDLALKEDTPAMQEARKTFAKGHSWENSVGVLVEKILMSMPHESTIG